MNIKSMAKTVTNKFGRQALKAQKNAPTILFVAGVVGVVGTVVLASRSTLKLEEVLEDAREDIEKANGLREEMPDAYSEQDRKRDMTIIYTKAAGKIVKLYAPAVALGGLSIMALSGSHIILTRRNVALTAAYAALDKGFREYRQRVSEELGEDKEREIRRPVNREVTEKAGKSLVTIARPYGLSPYSVLFDESNKNWDKENMYNQMFLRSMQNWANDLLNARGHLFLNEVYDMLGFPRITAGQVVGWVKNNPNGGDGYVDFGVLTGDVFSAQRFINGDERNVWLDFNVDGVVHDLI